jgi:hypothetical protein
VKPVKLHGMDKMGLRRRLSLDDEFYFYSMIPLSWVARADLSHRVMGNQYTPPHIMASMESYRPDLAQSMIINFPSGEQLKHTVSWHPAKKLEQNLQQSSDNRPRRVPPGSCPKNLVCGQNKNRGTNIDFTVLKSYGGSYGEFSELGFPHNYAQKKIART